MSVIYTRRVATLVELTSENQDNIEKLEQEHKDLTRERIELKDRESRQQVIHESIKTIDDEAKPIEEAIKAFEIEVEDQLYPLPLELEGRRASHIFKYLPRHSQLSEEYHKLKSTEAGLKDKIAEEQSKSLDDILEGHPKVLSVVNILNEKIEEYVSARTKYDSEMDAIVQERGYIRVITESMLRSGSDWDNVVYCLNHMNLFEEKEKDILEEIRSEDDEFPEAINWSKIAIDLKLAFGEDVLLQFEDKINKETYTNLRESYLDMKEKENIPTSVFGDVTDSIGNFLTEYIKE